ncbi:MAG: DUF1889 family protein [Acinetobacter sp.]
MDNLLIVALDSLNNRINVSTGLGHPLDESAAKELFKILHKEGVVLDEQELTNWAMNKGWHTKHANELGELGQKIGDGGRVQVKQKNRWGSDILEKWKERAQNL